MPAITNHQLRLVARPTGAAGPEHFEATEEPARAPEDGKVLGPRDGVAGVLSTSRPEADPVGEAPPLFRVALRRAAPDGNFVTPGASTTLRYPPPPSDIAGVTSIKSSPRMNGPS